jgi:integrase
MWWMSFTLHGRQRYESCHTSSRREAQKVLQARLGEIAQGRYHAPVSTKSPLLSAWSDEFLKTIADENTKRRYKSSIGNLKAYFGKARLAEVTPRDLELFKQQRLSGGVRAATVNRDLAVCRRMLKLALQQRMISESPFTDGVELLEERKNRRQPHILSWEQQKNLLAVAPPRIRLEVVLGTETGMRTGEMFGLRWSDIDFENEVIFVRKSKTFSGVRSVPISKFCKAELVRWQALLGPQFSEWVFPNFSNTRHRLQGGRKSWTSALKKAGIPYFRRYDLRHCFASRLSAAGASPITIAGLLGHSSTGIVMTYAKAIEDARVDAIHKLEEYRRNSISAMPETPLSETTQ